jgi:hypothetical protein
MARVKVHALCLRPISECDCPEDDPDDVTAEDDAAEGETR